MMNITSQFYENNEYGVKFRYFVDTQDIWWYNYDDICKYLELCSSVASRIYKYNIDECKSLDDGNYMIYSNTLISVDGKLKTE